MAEATEAAELSAGVKLYGMAPITRLYVLRLPAASSAPFHVSGGAAGGCALLGLKGWAARFLEIEDRGAVRGIGGDALEGDAFVGVVAGSEIDHRGAHLAAILRH